MKIGRFEIQKPFQNKQPICEPDPSLYKKNVREGLKDYFNHIVRRGNIFRNENKIDFRYLGHYPNKSGETYLYS